jgi:hypothetical protein
MTDRPPLHDPRAHDPRTHDPRAHDPRAHELRALRDKYEEMLRLRLLHARAREQADFAEPDPRAAMAELARRFPGALRELDELPLDAIRGRIAALASAEADDTCREPWMHAQARFHALTRGALAVKRWLRGRPLTPALVEAFPAALATMPEADEARAWSEDLAALARPPRGRLMEPIYARLARELGLELATARAAVMPPSRARSRAERALAERSLRGGRA